MEKRILITSSFLQKNIIAIIAANVMSLWYSCAIALEQGQLTHENQLTQIATDRCNSEQIEGKNYTIRVLGDGRLEVHFFGKKGGEVKGAFIYTQEQWDGRQRVLRDHQVSENSNRRQCIREELKSLRDSYVPPHSEGLTPQKPFGFSTDEDGFVVKKDGSRVCEERIDEQELEMYKAQLAAYGNKQPAYRKYGDIVLSDTGIEPMEPMAKEKCLFYNNSWVSPKSKYKGKLPLLPLEEQ